MDIARHEERRWGEIKSGYTHFKNGDVVMAKITPCFENGESAVMNGLAGGFGAGTTELHVFRQTGEGVLPEFVILYLKTRGFITRGIPRMTGSAGQKRVPSDYLAKSPFPPLAEQRRIVAKVEQLMALMDALETQLAASRTTAENLLTSLVTELTTS
jgi:type I restriction enzyme S subunit